jgi:hypothetical protein
VRGMRKTRRAGLGGITLGIMLGLATQSTDAQNGLQWLYQSGDWGAWAAYAVPDTDHFIFSIGCVEGPEGVTLHVELPVFELGEGEPAWIELHRDDMTMRYDGRVFFNEMMSEHQVIGYAPRVAETFDWPSAPSARATMARASRPAAAYMAAGES